MGCRHYNTVDHNGIVFPLTRRCVDCHDYVSLGPATDDERTAVEQRATFLADAWDPVGGIARIATDDERRGWTGWPYRQPENEAEHVGFLAAQIRHHEPDLRGANWAGQHMADHPITTTPSGESGEKE